MKNGRKRGGAGQNTRAGGAKRPTTARSGQSASAAQEAVVVKKSAIGRMSRGERRRHLDERLQSLYQREMFIESQLRLLDDNRFYRCCIFGSARLKPETKVYNDVTELARLLAGVGIDILTGGGPGLMEAANKGAKIGQREQKTKSRSLGITIQLDFEPVPNSHLDVKRHHHRFSSRLDDFMRLSNCIICTPGGIGTLLELYFSWQLIQVKHIERRPIILMDRGFWTGIIEWMKNQPLARGLISPPDFDFVSIVDSPQEAFDLVNSDRQLFRAKHAAGAD
jgi:uncharacterized protein (TIGR00730 family)